MLVCKDWNALARPYLYECIIIQQRRHLPYLCPKVSRDAPTYHTKRLDIVVPRQDQMAGLSEDTLLVQLARRLPRFSIITLHVSDSPRTPVSRSLLAGLISNNSMSLELLNWSHNCWIEDTLIKLYRTAPNLRAVRYDSVRYDSGVPMVTDLSGRPGAGMSTLTTTLIIGRSMVAQHDHATIHLPALRQVVFDPRIVWEYLQPFFRLNGSTVDTIIIQNNDKPRHDFDYYQNPYWGCQRTLHNLSETCSNLTTILVTFPNWQSFDYCLVIPPTVQKIGLQCKKLQSTNHEYDMLYSALNYLQAESLEVVRLLDARTVLDLRERHKRIFIKIGVMLAQRGWLFEDGDGSELA